MKKAALHNLGCKVNAYETEAMQQILEKAGYEIVPFHEFADVYVINTCSVTNMADRKSRQMLHRAKKLNPDAVVVGAGCYVQTKEAQALVDEAIDIVIGNNRKHELIQLLEEHESSKQKTKSIVDINHEKQEYEELFLEKTAEHTRAFIKVQDGCNQFCSYCIIPFARGRVRSRKAEDVLDEIRRLAENGYREVVLTGIHLSSYGIDIEDSLLHLIEKVHEVEGIERIRLGSLEPRIVTEDFAKRLSELTKICPHFHLSLQSGCDTVLARMNRRYDTVEYEEGCRLLRKYFLHPAITTDVIVGFPGETEEEFEITRNYLERIHFYEMHIFKYSKREGTKAAVMPQQVPEEKKTERSAVLLELEKKMSKEYRDYYLGKEETALLEEEMILDGEKYFTGYTREYVKVAVRTDKNLENQFVHGRIEKQLKEDIYLLVEFLGQTILKYKDSNAYDIRMSKGHLMSCKYKGVTNMQNINNTQYFRVEKEPELKVSDVLAIVYRALSEKGYNPVNQIVGYIMSGDPTYITSHNNARSLIMKVERDELVEEVLKAYIRNSNWE